MMDILQRLISRAGGASPHQPAGQTSGIRPRLSSRYEGAGDFTGVDAKPSTPAETAANIQDNAQPNSEPAAQNPVPEIKNFAPPQSKLQMKFEPSAIAPHKFTPLKPVRTPSETPEPLVQKRREAPTDPHLGKTETEPAAEKEAANIVPQKAVMFDAEKRSKRPEQSETRDRNWSPPDQLQPSVPVTDPITKLTFGSDQNPRPTDRPTETNQPPDVIIQIDRIDIQLEKEPPKPQKRQARRENLTDLSSYLSGKGERR